MFMVLENHFVYVKRTIGRILFLTLYVGDILLAGDNLEMTKATMSFVFGIKDYVMLGMS